MLTFDFSDNDFGILHLLLDIQVTREEFIEKPCHTPDTSSVPLVYSTISDVRHLLFVRNYFEKLVKYDTDQVLTPKLIIRHKCMDFPTWFFTEKSSQCLCNIFSQQEYKLSTFPLHWFLNFFNSELENKRKYCLLSTLLLNDRERLELITCTQLAAYSEGWNAKMISRSFYST